MNKGAWTSEKPTAPGWYWFRRKKGDGSIEFTTIVEVVKIHGRVHMSDSGDVPLSGYNHGSFRGYEWQPVAPAQS